MCIFKIRRLIYQLFYIRIVNIDKCVNIGRCSFGSEYSNYLLAVLRQFDQGIGFDHRTSILNVYYKNCSIYNQPGIFLTLQGQEKHKSLVRKYIPPWGGGKTVDPRNSFEHWIGPKTLQQIDYFLLDYKKLYERIKKDGYKILQQRFDMIKVHKLVSKNTSKYLVTAGQKRCAILKHCGHKWILVMLSPPGDIYPDNMPPTIDVCNVEKWSNVKSGLFTKRQAINFLSQYLNT
jgi:hypothetical protein